MRMIFSTAHGLLLLAVLVGVDAKNSTQTLPKPEISVSTYGSPPYITQK